MTANLRAVLGLNLLLAGVVVAMGLTGDVLLPLAWPVSGICVGLHLAKGRPAWVHTLPGIWVGTVLSMASRADSWTRSPLSLAAASLVTAACVLESLLSQRFTLRRPGRDGSPDAAPLDIRSLVLRSGPLAGLAGAAVGWLALSLQLGAAAGSVAYGQLFIIRLTAIYLLAPLFLMRASDRRVLVADLPRLSASALLVFGVVVAVVQNEALRTPLVLLLPVLALFLAFRASLYSLCCEFTLVGLLLVLLAALPAGSLPGNWMLTDSEPLLGTLTLVVSLFLYAFIVLDMATAHAARMAAASEDSHLLATLVESKTRELRQAHDRLERLEWELRGLTLEREQDAGVEPGSLLLPRGLFLGLGEHLLHLSRRRGDALSLLMLRFAPGTALKQEAADGPSVPGALEATLKPLSEELGPEALIGRLDLCTVGVLLPRFSRNEAEALLTRLCRRLSGAEAGDGLSLLETGCTTAELGSPAAAEGGEPGMRALMAGLLCRPVR
ncbi:hypothetical protein EVJ50_03660 [Synechococcus sp. RSCCF101]|uniref:hypothetical protein n=1 Tax=Synechococcus sp. RSCCF101 TaxID=2511069 RepID=UPI001244840E|nr:hypothetical protein [Synechococcus sp. RSCCF101]QEY31482.1 hypothetical protein EVJ50_03660 [Synechococcus sp. RSCCF101]